MQPTVASGCSTPSSQRPWRGGRLKATAEGQRGPRGEAVGWMSSSSGDQLLAGHRVGKVRPSRSSVFLGGGCPLGPGGAGERPYGDPAQMAERRAPLRIQGVTCMGPGLGMDREPCSVGSAPALPALCWMQASEGATQGRAWPSGDPGPRGCCHRLEWESGKAWLLPSSQSTCGLSGPRGLLSWPGPGCRRAQDPRRGWAELMWLSSLGPHGSWPQPSAPRLRPGPPQHLPPAQGLLPLACFSAAAGP